MSDRTRSAALNGTRTTRSSGLANVPGGGGGSNNSSSSKTSLFRSHFIRRSNVPAADSAAESVRLDAEMTPRAEASDLVVRDQHGEVEIGNPPTPVVDDEEELQALEYQQENESMGVFFFGFGFGFVPTLLSTAVMRKRHANDGICRGETASGRGDSALSNQSQLYS